MPNGKQDLRVVKTRRNIEETFVLLLEEMPFDQITVRLVVERALVNKGTFYRHYQDKYDLAENAFARVMGEVRAGIRERVSGLAKGAPIAGLMRSFSEAQADTMPRLMAFRGVPLKNGTVEAQVERLFSEEFSRASREWGGDVEAGTDVPDWAVSSLAMGYLRHCWETGEAGDLLAYLEAVHRVSGIYLEQLDRG